MTIVGLHTDAELWGRTIAGDIAAFERVVERYQAAVAGVAYSILGDFALCQDVAQETFWAAWRSRNDLRDHERLGAWLCGIARNLAHQSLKKFSNHSNDQALESLTESSGQSDPVLQSISKEESSLVWSALAEIPEIYREALILYYRQGESIEGVATALDISIDAAKQRLSRGREKVKSQLSMTVEGVLRRTRPSRTFTQNVIAGVAALSASIKVVSSATAAAGTAATAKAVGTAVTTASQASSGTMVIGATSGAAWGILGGLLGSLGGLLGAFLGIFIPAQLAPTMTERRIVETNGKKILVVTIIFTLLILVISLYGPKTGFNAGTGGVRFQLVTTLLTTICFIAYVTVNTLSTIFTVRKIRKLHTPATDPNDSMLRNFVAKRIPQQNMIGRKYTSKLQLLGLPLIDIQFADKNFAAAFAGQSPDQSQLPRTAFGWIAVGDRANGLLFALGGIANGSIAIGGCAFGVVALGGFACGLVAVGGGAIGLLLAFGGLGIGYDAVGGGAIGWHSATGGAAIAYHAAMGGGAVAHDFAVGGGAWAAEYNTLHAKEAIANETYAGCMEYYVKNQSLCLPLLIAFSAFPALLARFCYTRERLQSEQASNSN